jgi:hypothetical protein
VRSTRRGSRGSIPGPDGPTVLRTQLPTTLTPSAGTSFATDRMDLNVHPMSIAMVGTRGVPARYGGFETAVEEVGRRLADAGHRVVVYCRTAPTDDGSWRRSATPRCRWRT